MKKSTIEVDAKSRYLIGTISTPSSGGIQALGEWEMLKKATEDKFNINIEWGKI